jgi:succinoglycan biosynthesis transport protein ExoP
LSKPQDDDASNRQFMQQEVDSLQIKIEKGRNRLESLQTQATASISPERLNELKIEIDTLERFITDWEDTYSRLLLLLESNVSQNSLTIIEEAHANSKPVSPNTTLNILFSACIGFGLALGAIFLLNLLDDRIKTSETLEKDLGLNHLGSISKMKGRNYEGKLIASQNPLFGSGPHYRKILNNIGFIEKGDRPLRSLLVTSPRLREGKSVTASNLAIMMAQAGFRTIIVDVDWIKPVQHLLFNVSNKIGLMDLLATPDLVTKEQLQLTGIPNLKILTAGTPPENPVELIEPKRMKKILSDLSRISNAIILDAPSTTIAESAVLFSMVEGVILVIDSNHTKTASIKQSMTSLYLTGGKLLGGVLNRSPSYWRVS